MRRKILTILLVLALCVCMAAPVSAAQSYVDSSQPQSAYAQLRQYLTCLLFARGCNTPTASRAPSGSAAQDPASAEPSRPAEPAPQASAAPEPTKPDSSAPARLPETPSASDGVSMEQQVVLLVNQQRAAYGLPALKPDSSLSDYARIKSQDLHDNRYFDHQSPTYGSPFDMMHSFGITYSYAGENIAMGYSDAQAVVSAWMNSSSHRANILNAHYDRIGVGYVADGGYWTQWFLG